MSFKKEDIIECMNSDIRLLKKSGQRHIQTRGKVKLPTGMVGNLEERNCAASPKFGTISNRELLRQNISKIYRF